MNHARFKDSVVGAGVKVPVADGSLRKYVNFDNAASTPAMKQVLERINEFMPWYSSVHRGSGYKSRISTELYDKAHSIVADFVGANPAEHTVIFGKNTTEAINKLSFRLELSKKDIVLVSQLEHHSNDLPWRAHATVKRIKITPRGEVDATHYEYLLKKYKGRVRLVAISGASNVTGYLPGIYSFAKSAHAAGAQIMIDAAQLGAHRPIRMGRLSDPEHLDYVALSAHKMYAPFGTGALIGRRDTFSKGVPEHCGGGTIEVVTTDTVDWAAPPDRDEAGSPNVVGAVAFAAALQELQKIGFGEITRHETLLTGYALRRLREIPGLKIYGNSDPLKADAQSGVISFNINGFSHFLVAAILSYEWAIAVRNGCFCAHPYVVSLLGIADNKMQSFRKKMLSHHKSDMPGLVRISFGLYNTTEEIDYLIMALQEVAAGNYLDKYHQDSKTGEFHLPRQFAEPSNLMLSLQA